ncbi:MAG: hypothetical protein GY725_09700 [bacterium]|nr:hypothetical protein [bacterium]
MRIEYKFGLDDVEVPCFSVESSEGPQKLFTLATLVLNVLYDKPRVDVIFHSPNRDDLPKKIQALEKILGSAPIVLGLKYEEGSSGSVGSSYYQWVSIHATGGSEKG